MRITDRLISLSILGAMTLVVAPMASAQETDPTSRCDRFEGERQERCLERVAKWQQVKEDCAELEGQERRECAIEITGKHAFVHGRFRRHVRRDVKEVCTDHERGTDEFRACVQEQRKITRSEIKEKHPKAFRRHRIGHRLYRNFGDLSDQQKEEIREKLQACRDEETFQEKRTCMKDVLSAYKDDTNSEEG